MPGYFQNMVTVTVKDFERTQRGGVMGKIGWDSAQMITVRTALAEFWKDPGKDTKKDLQHAVQTWHAENAPNSTTATASAAASAAVCSTTWARRIGAGGCNRSSSMEKTTPSPPRRRGHR